MEKNWQIKVKEETRTAVINALREMASRDTANTIRPMVEFIRTLNLESDEQWDILNRFADKVVRFRKSGDITDLK